MSPPSYVSREEGGDEARDLPFPATGLRITLCRKLGVDTRRKCMLSLRLASPSSLLGRLIHSGLFSSSETPVRCARTRISLFCPSAALPYPAVQPRSRLLANMAPQRRLNQLLNELTAVPAPIGTLKLGDITYEVPASLTPSKLSRSTYLLDILDPINLDNLHFLLQKYILGQDVFLVSQPGPYARRLALTFARSGLAMLLICLWLADAMKEQYHQCGV